MWLRCFRAKKVTWELFPPASRIHLRVKLSVPHVQSAVPFYCTGSTEPSPAYQLREAFIRRSASSQLLPISISLCRSALQSNTRTKCKLVQVPEPTAIRMQLDLNNTANCQTVPVVLKGPKQCINSGEVSGNSEETRSKANWPPSVFAFRTMILPIHKHLQCPKVTSFIIVWSASTKHLSPSLGSDSQYSPSNASRKYVLAYFTSSAFNAKAQLIQ